MSLRRDIEIVAWEQLGRCFWPALCTHAKGVSAVSISGLVPVIGQ